VLWSLLAHFITVPYHVYAIVALVILSTTVGIPAATLEARGCGRKDPSQVVIDEVAGQWVTLIGAPVHFAPMFLGFLLFRFFDILKPPPIRTLEKLPEGTGIVVDDLGAGVYGWIVLQILLYFARLKGWHWLA
jgi:phosphatidylglycerophosphatase A